MEKLFKIKTSAKGFIYSEWILGFTFAFYIVECVLVMALKNKTSKREI